LNSGQKLEAFAIVAWIGFCFYMRKVQIPVEILQDSRIRQRQELIATEGFAITA
jgi:hypothetical protein